MATVTCFLGHIYVITWITAITTKSNQHLIKIQKL